MDMVMVHGVFGISGCDLVRQHFLGHTAAISDGFGYSVG